MPMAAEFCQLLTGDGVCSSQVRIHGKSCVFDTNTGSGLATISKTNRPEKPRLLAEHHWSQIPQVGCQPSIDGSEYQL